MERWKCFFSSFVLKSFKADTSKFSIALNSLSLCLIYSLCVCAHAQTVYQRLKKIKNKDKKCPSLTEKLKKYNKLKMLTSAFLISADQNVLLLS